MKKSSDFIVRVNSCENLTMQGYIEHIASGQVVRFDSCLEMYLQLHEKLEDMGYPQATTSMRTWND